LNVQGQPLPAAIVMAASATLFAGCAWLAARVARGRVFLALVRDGLVSGSPFRQSFILWDSIESFRVVHDDENVLLKITLKGAKRPVDKGILGALRARLQRRAIINLSVLRAPPEVIAARFGPTWGSRSVDARLAWRRAPTRGSDRVGRA
jgi:hypothetical protein